MPGNDQRALVAVSGTPWRETSVMRRDYIDLLGDHIPRGQKHFKLWPDRGGCCRLSVRSIYTLRAAAGQGDAAAVRTLAEGTRSSSPSFD